MTLARILIAALLFFFLPAFTQAQTSVPHLPTPHLPTMGPSSFASSTAAMSTEPWRIIPNPNSNSEPTNHMLVDQFRLDRSLGNAGARTHTLALGLDGLDSDTTCYKIRSYVVARDSEDSDSTHMTGYSTCQPAAKYRVKTTEGDPILLQP